MKAGLILARLTLGLIGLDPLPLALAVATGFLEPFR